MVISLPFLSRPPKVSIVRLHGVIGGVGRFSEGLSDAGLASLLERAFRVGKPAAVALSINSPGGSPVQSSLIAARIRRLAEKHKLPVHAFVEDVAASGGYWLACAGDDIWADESSILGSIGVISASFGAHELIGRYGIERRVQTAGRSKSFSDPFRPQGDEDRARLQAVLDPIHDAFIAHVKDRRGARLDATTDLFQGEFWTGKRAVELGLADGIAHMVPKLQALYGEKVRLPVVAQRLGLLRRAGLRGVSGEVAGAVLGVAEERALWSRFGL